MIWKLPFFVLFINLTLPVSLYLKLFSFFSQICCFRSMQQKQQIKRWYDQNEFYMFLISFARRWRYKRTFLKYINMSESLVIHKRSTHDLLYHNNMNICIDGPFYRATAHAASYKHDYCSRQSTNIFTSLYYRGYILPIQIPNNPLIAVSFKYLRK